jgi:predicted MFS family arabinose efflux permease
MYGEKRHKTNLFFCVGILLITLSQIGMAVFEPALTSMVIFLVLFFGAFNYLEALLPSEVSKRVAPDKKGTALGIFSASQFIGIFCGGALGGVLFANTSMSGVHIFAMGMTLAWLVLVLWLPNEQPEPVKNGLEEDAV